MATTVTVNLKSIFGENLASNTFVRFILRNYGRNIPRVTSTGVLVKVVQDAFPDAAGLVSKSVTSNADISPSGTYYSVEYYNSGIKTASADYLINGGSVNLNSASPISSTPVVTPPDGDTTYLRVDGGNTNLTGTNAFTFGNLNKIRNADAFTGANAGEKITAALASLAATSATGGTIDARGLEGAQTISSLVLNLANVDLLLGAATFTVTSTAANSAGIKVTANNVHIIGSGHTVIQQTRDWINDDYDLIGAWGVDGFEIRGVDAQLTMTGAVGTAASNLHAIAVVGNGATNSTNFRIIGNRAWTRGTDPGLTYRMSGIFAGDVTETVRPKGGLITGNIVEECLERNIYTYHTEDVIIEQNTIINPCAGGTSSQTGRGIRIVDMLNGVVSNNVISFTDASALLLGITIEGGQVTPSQNVLIEGNTVLVNAATTGGVIGFYLSNVLNASLISNKALNLQSKVSGSSYGVFIDTQSAAVTTKQLKVSGNFLSGWSDDQIQIDDTSVTDVEVSNNYIGRTAAGTDSPVVGGLTSEQLTAQRIWVLNNSHEQFTLLENYEPAGVKHFHRADTGQTVTYDSGSTAAQNSQIEFRDRGTFEGKIQKGSDNNLYIYDALSKVRLGVTQAGATRLNSDSTSPVQFNATANAGTGGVEIYGGGASPALVASVTSAGLSKAVRHGTLGTSLVAGDFALSAGWGDAASIGTITGKDQWCQFTVTSSGTGQGASPTIILTFKDGTWTTAPIVQANRQEFANQPTVTFSVTTVTATAVTLTFNGTPVAAETYRLTLFVGGI